MNTTESPFIDEDYSMTITEILESIFLGIVCVVGTIGNLLVVAAVITTRSLQVRQNVFIVVLALTDLLTAAILTPFFILCLARGGWPFEEISCIVMGFLTILSITTSALTVNCIAVCRYVTVAYTNPVRRKLMHGRVVIAASATLVIVDMVALFLPNCGFGDVGFNSDVGHCTLKYDNEYEWYYSAFLIILGVTFAFTVVPISYTLIFCIVRKSKISIEIMTISSRTERSTSPEHSSSNSSSRRNKSLKTNHPRRNMSRDELRLSKKLLLLFGLFSLCWIPYSAAILADRNSTVPQWIHRATNFLVWVNPSLNPFLYAWMIQSYRQAYTRLIKDLFCHKRFCTP